MSAERFLTRVAGTTSEPLVIRVTRFGLPYTGLTAASTAALRFFPAAGGAQVGATVTRSNTPGASDSQYVFVLAAEHVVAGDYLVEAAMDHVGDASSVDYRIYRLTVTARPA